MNRVKIYAKTIDSEALEQINNMSNSEAYCDCDIRIMPDCHAGKGCTIGTVIKLHNRIVPNSVGVDIGCGMLVVKIGSAEINLELLDKVINTYIPSGFNSHVSPIVIFEDIEKLICINNLSITNIQRQIGTLGGGNHFIEVNVDDNNDKYLVIHSGSRNLGVKVCNYYQNLANNSFKSIKKDEREEIIYKLKLEGRHKDIERELKKLNQRKCSNEFAYLEGDNYDKYLHDMKIVQDYAKLNRITIANIIFNAMGWKMGEYFETIHNYIDLQDMILRKGAVSANEGEMLIIPINMRDGSLICRGKGNLCWLNSAPHGAGRIMSRAKARESISIDDYIHEMSSVYSTSVCISTIDEAPMAYKPIEEIIECIEPTVDIIEKITPIYNFKAK